MYSKDRGFITRIWMIKAEILHFERWSAQAHVSLNLHLNIEHDTTNV